MKQKVALYILSMSLFFVIVGLLCMDIPICLDDKGVFIGFHQLWLNTRIGLAIIATTILVEGVVFCYLKNLWSHSPKELSVEVTNVEELNYDTLAFIASFMIPLVSFQMEQLEQWVVLVILVVVIGVIFCNSKGYYTNPTLAILGFRLYCLSVRTQQVGNQSKERQLVVISRQKLMVGCKFRYVKVTDAVGYVL